MMGEQVQWLRGRREHDMSKEVEKDRRTKPYDVELTRELTTNGVVPFRPY